MLHETIAVSLFARPLTLAQQAACGIATHFIFTVTGPLSILLPLSPSFLYFPSHPPFLSLSSVPYPLYPGFDRHNIIFFVLLFDLYSTKCSS